MVCFLGGWYALHRCIILIVGEVSVDQGLLCSLATARLTSCSVLTVTSFVIRMFSYTFDDHCPMLSPRKKRFSPPKSTIDPHRRCAAISRSGASLPVRRWDCPWQPCCLAPNLPFLDTTGGHWGKTSASWSTTLAPTKLRDLSNAKRQLETYWLWAP